MTVRPTRDLDSLERHVEGLGLRIGLVDLRLGGGAEDLLDRRPPPVALEGGEAAGVSRGRESRAGGRAGGGRQRHVARAVGAKGEAPPELVDVLNLILGSGR